jgi:hypothetical protein
VTRSTNFEFLPLRDPVFRFVSTAQSYCAYCESGLRLDIVRCRNLLLEQTDPDDYWNFLWMQSLQGFFILRQRVQVGITEDWILVGELITNAPLSQFFDLFQDHFEAVVRGSGLCDPPIKDDPAEHT